MRSKLTLFEELRRLTFVTGRVTVDAVQKYCSCGGGDPGDSDICDACLMYHEIERQLKPYREAADYAVNAAWDERVTLRDRIRRACVWLQNLVDEGIRCDYTPEQVNDLERRLQEIIRDLRGERGRP